VFTSKDFFDILNYLKTGTVSSTSSLDPSTKNLSESEKSVVETLFEHKLDQSVFSTNDYKRLRSMFIDWYTSHKSLITTQRKVSDIFSLPKSHLNELVKSFGFDISLENLSLVNESNFFLDLVNLYKIKGTPKSIVDVLKYYGMKLVLLEYWLQKDTSGELIFRPYPVTESSVDVDASDVPITDIDFQSVVGLDPHWIITESNILSLFNSKDIVFPIKSPYFGLRPVYYLEEIILIISIIAGRCANEYQTWLSTGTVPQDVIISSTNVKVSLLELFLSCSYLLNVYSGSVSSSFGNFYAYNGTSIIFSDVINQYNDLINTRNVSRLERKLRVDQFYNLFTKPSSESFIKPSLQPEVLLKSINPSLRADIDSQILAGKTYFLLSSFLKDLTDWVLANLSVTYSNFTSFILGLGSLELLRQIFNFFKPYRARALLVDSGFVIKNPLVDSIIVEDGKAVDVKIDLSFIDFDTPDSRPGFLEDWVPVGAFIYSSSPTPDDSIVTNIYLDSTGLLRCEYETSPDTIYLYSNPPAGAYRIYGLYLQDDGTEKKMIVTYGDTVEIVGGISTKVLSNPVEGYLILSVFINSLIQFSIVYDPTWRQSYDDDTSGRLYYSRVGLDRGSYFDVGTATDPILQSCDLEVISTIGSTLNMHPPDSSKYTYCEYTLDITSNVQTVFTTGGFTDFDCGGVFDNPNVSDICLISVIPSS